MLYAFTISKPSHHKLRGELEGAIMGGMIGKTAGMEKELTEQDF